MDKLSSKVKTIISHEYVSKVKTKSFIFATLLGPLGLIVMMGIVIAATILSKGDTDRKLAVVDYYGGIAEKLVDADTSKYFLSNESPEALDAQILDGSIDGYLVIPKEIIEEGEIDVFGKGGGGLGYIEALKSNINVIVRKERLLQFGADEKVINLVESRVRINTQKVTEEGKQDDATAALAGVGYAMGFAIYILMLLYGGWVSRSVIEEKANRIIEVIVSSARPFDILLGKVTAIGLLGLTQIVVWVSLGGVLMYFASNIAMLFVDIDPQSLQSGMTVDAAQQAEVERIMKGIPDITWGMVLGFVFYFISGYFIYASLFAALGSAVDQEQDAAQLQTPLTMFIIMPILLVQVIMANPDGTLATALSLFPLFTPILMIVRVGATTIPIWQIALSVVLMIGSFLGALWVAARIYRVGILMTGKKPSFKDLIKWIRA